jgi:signal transduction histidine kinase
MLQRIATGIGTRRVMRGYAAAIASVAAAVVMLLVMQARWHASAPVSMFVMAVIVTTWLGGTKPGLLAAALSFLSFDYFMLYVEQPASAGPIQLMRVLALATVAAYVIWLTATERRAAESLRRARDDLQKNNEALRADISERERAEQTVRDSQQLVQQVLATLPVGVMVTDQEGDVILTNAASKRIWGDSPPVSGADRWAQSKGYWHDTGRRIAPTEWAAARALFSGDTSLNEFIDVDTYDGKRKTIQNSAAPIRNAAGETVGAVIVNEDVTERIRAEQALQESANRLQHLSRRLLAVQEDERRHLSRELHDEFGQLLATVTLHLHAAKRLAGDPARASLDESIALLQRAGSEVRSLALELRPTMLETGGLDAALRWLAEQHRQRTGIDTEVTGELGDVPSGLAIACFRVAQEALTNVARHAQARHVGIESRQGDGSLHLLIRDDGVGFNVSEALQRAASGGHLGLLGMKERAQILGGTVEIDAFPGRGTRIRVVLPVPEPGVSQVAGDPNP